MKMNSNLRKLSPLQRVFVRFLLVTNDPDAAREIAEELCERVETTTRGGKRQYVRRKLDWYNFWSLYSPADHTLKMVNATKIIYFTDKGTVCDSRVVPDWNTQFKGIKLVFKVMGMYPKGADRSPQQTEAQIREAEPTIH
jgi:hypothetical protein